ncbi:MAG TPA: sugar phosphate isomerase/epimerase family protein [Candidatus Rifleibacterium sp.]|nr:sugar phosphate isomerase/epimerase family protein [Candidatus Rifleibacterium sp.]HPT47465.1 sugar phosphate isomerase/epimerase family protein [Candidatus Rifleibacterium sp.]
MAQIFVNIAYQRMSADGFKFLAERQLFPEFYFCGDSIDSIERETITALRDQIAGSNFSSTLHAPFYDLNIGARDRSIRIASFERLVWAVETAAMLGAGVVVVHPGYGVGPGEVAIEPWLQRAGAFLKKLVEHAAGFGIKIAFENIFDSRPDQLLKLLQFVDSPFAGICFDVGHHHLFSALPMQNWLAALGPHIFEFHLHDNDRSADQHSAIGEGSVDYQPLIDWYANQPAATRPVLTLEQKDRNHVIKSVACIQNWGI